MEQIEDGYGWSVFVNGHMANTGTEETHNGASRLAREIASDLRAIAAGTAL